MKIIVYPKVMRRQFTKSLYNDLGGVETVVSPLSTARQQSIKRGTPFRPKSVPESMMGMASPSHSTKGSFGPKTRTCSRCPIRPVFPGPGHYQNKYAMVVVRSSRKN